jgi:hypothetical protein
MVFGGGVLSGSPDWVTVFCEPLAGAIVPEV